MRDYKTPLQEFLDRSLSSKENIRVLEAGCGSLSKVSFKQKVHMTGIDISAKQLERNQYLHEKIQGDLQTYNFTPSSFDIIVCWDVLEHLQKPRLALDNMTTSLKPGGLMLLKLPNLMSVKGLFTKFSPHSIHVLYYKVIYKKPDAGKNDTGPFKTHLKYAVAPQSIKKYAAVAGLDVPYFDLHDITDNSYLFARTKYPGLLRGIYKSIKTFFRIITFGRLSDSEMIIILQKPLLSPDSVRDSEKRIIRTSGILQG